MQHWAACQFKQLPVSPMIRLQSNRQKKAVTTQNSQRNRFFMFQQFQRRPCSIYSNIKSKFHLPSKCHQKSPINPNITYVNFVGALLVCLLKFCLKKIQCELCFVLNDCCISSITCHAQAEGKEWGRDWSAEEDISNSSINGRVSRSLVRTWILEPQNVSACVEWHSTKQRTVTYGVLLDSMKGFHYFREHRGS